MSRQSAMKSMFRPLPVNAPKLAELMQLEAGNRAYQLCTAVPVTFELPSPPMPADVHFGKQLSPLYRAWADKCAMIIGSPVQPINGPVTIDVSLSGQEQFVRAVLVADLLAELGVYTGPRKVNVIEHVGEGMITTLYYCVSIS